MAEDAISEKKIIIVVIIIIIIIIIVVVVIIIRSKFDLYFCQNLSFE
jgi:hypothetical protein